MRSLLTASVLTCTTLLTWTAALLLLPSTDAHRGCVHDKVVQKRPHRVPQPLGGRRSSGWDPIRIEFDTSGIDAAVPSDTKAYIEELVAECKTWLQAALKVHRLQGNLVLTAQGDGQTGCGPDQPSIPSKYTATGGGGAADLVIFVLSQPSSENCADGNTLAYASHCRQDSQTDRPIAGYIQMCPQHHARKTIKSQRDEDFHTALHEILHIMGWSSALFPFFRSSDGQPITSRCGDPSDSQWLPTGAKAYNQNHSSFSDSDYCCASNYVGDPPFLCTASSWEYQVSPNTVTTKAKTAALNTTGTARTLLKTPQLLARARSYFECSTLEGVDLEDDGGSGSAGSHWEERQLVTEFMAAAPSGMKNVKSEFTLALMEDSGWYKPDYSQAEAMRWGYKKGCTFTDTCGPVSTSGFCLQQNKWQCSFDRSGMGNCSNTDKYMDGCPITRALYMCSDFKGTPSDIGFFGGNCGGSDCKGATYSDASACFESSLFKDGWTSTWPRVVGCYEFTCNKNDTHIESGLMIKDPTGTWRNCTRPGETFTNIAGYSGTLSCPDDWELLCAFPGSSTGVQLQVTTVPRYPENSPHYVTMRLTLPYTLAEFDTPTVRAKLERAVAAVANTIPENVFLTIKSSTTRRMLLAASVDVEAKIVVASAQAASDLRSRLEAGGVMTKVNSELQKEGLAPALSVTVTSSTDQKDSESALSNGSTRRVWAAGVFVWSCLLVVSTVSHQRG